MISSSKQRKNRPETWKVVPNSTNISQKYRKTFFPHADCACVHAWEVLFEHVCIKFPKSTVQSMAWV